MSEIPQQHVQEHKRLYQFTGRPYIYFGSSIEDDRYWGACTEEVETIVRFHSSELFQIPNPAGHPGAPEELCEPNHFERVILVSPNGESQYHCDLASIVLKELITDRQDIQEASSSSETSSSIDSSSSPTDALLSSV